MLVKIKFLHAVQGPKMLAFRERTTFIGLETAVSIKTDGILRLIRRSSTILIDGEWKSIQ
jgi:hypothetical protein